jgi:SpoIID/LytB domain protein
VALRPRGPHRNSRARVALPATMRRLAPTLLLLALGPAAPVASAASPTFYVKGAGFGHGVGMSQYGAQGYALHGVHYDRILAHYYQGTKLGRAPASTRIRVQLAAPSSVSVSHVRAAGSERLDPARTYTARRSHGRVELVSSSGRRVGRWRSVTLTGSGGWFRFGHRSLSGRGPGGYRGSLALGATATGVSAVNVVSLDSYVRGVVASEMPSSWKFEALKVQAVAARTYALATGVGQTLYPDTRSQVYGGMQAETAVTNSAVRHTSGQVVTYGGAPIVTYYFSTSGGRTEDVQNVFGGAPEPYLRSVRDPYDGISPRHRWTLRMSRAQAGAKLAGLYRGAFRSIEVLRRGRSPRIVRARVIGTRGSHVTDGATLRARLGAYDSWMRFYVLSAHRAPASVRAAAALRGAAGEGAAPLRTVLRGAGLLRGAIAGARPGALAIVERRDATRWRPAGEVRIGPEGAWSWSAPVAGTYRLSWLGMTTDPVRLG